MALYFFDTSAIVKRYVQEAGSDWVVSAVRANSIFLSEITKVEFCSAVVRRSNEGRLSSEAANILFSSFRNDLTGYGIVPISSGLIETAVTMVELYYLRAYDAVQLAAAVTIYRAQYNYGLSDIMFVSADEKLNRAAKEEGMVYINPNDREPAL